MRKKQFTGNRKMPRRGVKTEDEEDDVLNVSAQAASSGIKGSKFPTSKHKVTLFTITKGYTLF